MRCVKFACLTSLLISSMACFAMSNPIEGGPAAQGEFPGTCTNAQARNGCYNDLNTKTCQCSWKPVNPDGVSYISHDNWSVVGQPYTYVVACGQSYITGKRSADNFAFFIRSGQTCNGNTGMVWISNSGKESFCAPRSPFWSLTEYYKQVAKPFCTGVPPLPPGRGGL